MNSMVRNEDVGRDVECEVVIAGWGVAQKYSDVAKVVVGARAEWSKR
jgi:hypothetical protein